MKKRAIYDLCREPTTYDFAAWCVIAKTHGCDHVHFIIDGEIAHWKYPQDIAWARFGTILVPMCALAGMTYSVGTRLQGESFPYNHGAVEKMFKEGGRIEKLRSVARAPRSGHVTITLRESFRNAYRNSNPEAWEKFKGYLKDRGEDVIVFHECEAAPTNLHYRMAIYASAKMNLGVANGPMALCIFSEAPYITLNQLPTPPAGVACIDVRRLAEVVGFPEGSQYSFRNARQKLVYKPDTFENIVEAYEDMFHVKQEAIA
jgi:hypothetical protein